MENKIQKLPPNPKSILSQTVENIAAGIVGISDYNRDKLILSASHLVKSLIKGKLLDGLNQEWSSYVKEGRIKAGFDFSPEHYNTLAEMLDYLDNGVPNDKVFDVMRKIFFTSILEKKRDNESLLPYQYLQIAKQLSSIELTVLFTIRELLLNDGIPQDKRFYSDLENIHYPLIANKSKIMHSETVAICCNSLVDKRLLPKTFYDNPRFYPETNKTLTSLSKGFCEYIEKYDELSK